MVMGGEKVRMEAETMSVCKAEKVGQQGYRYVTSQITGKTMLHKNETVSDE